MKSEKEGLIYCPKCNFPETSVVDSRELDNHIIRRRRECMDCKWRFSTHETIVPSRITVIKRSGKKVLFDKTKIIKGIRIAATKRPVSKTDIIKIAEKVEQELLYRGKTSVKSWQIGMRIMNELKKIDEVTYLRFASVCRSFRSPKSFEKALHNLNKQISNQEG